MTESHWRYTEGSCRACFWERMFAELKEYKDEHGHCNVPRVTGRKLETWVKNQRCNRNEISEEQRERLDGIEFV